MLNVESVSTDESIVVVGVCGSGKSTLVKGLQTEGYPARVCMQEHSYVPTLWLRRGRPRALVYLDASLETVCQRRNVCWDEQVLSLQRQRLALARERCDLYIDTDGLGVEEVRERVLSYLRERDLFGP